MKTVVHLPPRFDRRPASALSAATLRLGVVVSVLAALIAATVHALTDVPSAVVVGGVVVVASCLSWRRTGPRSPAG